MRDVGTAIQIVGVKRLDIPNACGTQRVEHGLGDLVIGRGDDLAGFGVDNVGGQHATDEKVFGHRNTLDLRRGDIAQVANGDALVLFDERLAIAVGNVKTCDFAFPAIGHEFHEPALVLQLELVELEEVREDRLRRHADGLEQDRDRHLAATVNTEEQNVLGIEFEIKPGAAIRNHARREQQLARTMGLAAIVFEEHAGRTVKLRDNDALRSVNHKGSGAGHERNFAHVHFLLADFLGRGLADFAIKQDQPYLGAQRRRIGQAAQLTFLDVKHRLAKRIADELKAGHVVVARDRENRRERGLQPLFFTGGSQYVGLQEC